MKPACPDLEQCEAYVAGSLDERSRETLRVHVESCETCRALVDELRLGSDLLDALRPAWPESGAPRRGERPGAGRDREPIDVAGYEVVRLLHEGGQGAVYEAVQESTDRRVAIKVLLHGRRATDRERHRFDREIDLVTKLDQPNIVTIFDSGLTEDGRQFFVMQLVDGWSLDAYIRETSPPIGVVLRLFIKITDAVSYAHQHGVLHRDLKPTNVIVSADAEPHLLDFGLAKAVNEVEPKRRSVQTQAGEFLGTLAYAAPEQVRGDPGAIDTRSDVYTLGVMLFEVITGRLPYPVEGGLADVIRHITETDPPHPSRLRPDLDTDLDAILTMALGKEPARRYQTAFDFAADLRRYLRSEPISARPATAAYQLRKFARRHPALVAGVGAVFVVLVASTVVTTLLLVRAVSAEANAERRLGDIRSLANAFIFDVHDRIRFLPGSTEAREFIVATALEYLDRLADEAGEDATLQLELASAYLRIGDAQGGLLEANLGDTEGAEQSYRTAVATLERLAEDDPTDLDIRDQLGLGYKRLGDIRFARLEFDEAMARYDEAMALRRSEIEADPTRRAAHRSLMGLLTAMARVDTRKGAYDEAMTRHREALATGERLVAEDPDDAVATRSMSVQHSAIGKILAERAEPDEALVHLRQAQEVMLTMSDADRANTFIQRALSGNSISIGDVLLGQEKPAKALAYYQEALAIREESASADPNNALAVADLAVAHERVGDTLHASGQLEEALAHQMQALRLRQEVVDANPVSAEARRELSVGHEKVGNELAELERLDEAIEQFQLSLEIRAALVAASPSSARQQRDFAVSLFKIGSVLEMVGGNEALPTADRLARWREARRTFQRSLDEVDDMARRGVLAKSDAGVPGLLADRIAACDTAIIALTANPPQASR